MEDRELWRPVMGYEGFYEVSDKGNVRRIAKGRGAQVGKILKQANGTNGYKQVTLSKDCNQLICRVHRLVAEAFIPRQDGKDYVNHINGDKTDNRVENLEWVTRSENALHAYRVLGRKKERVIPENRVHKLNLKTVKEIFEADGTYADIARRFGISDVMARKIKLGICWSDVTCQ